VCVCVCVCFMEAFLWNNKKFFAGFITSLKKLARPQKPTNSFCLFIYSFEFYSKDDDHHHVFNRTYPQNFVAFLFAVMGLLCQIPLNYKMGNNNNNNNSCCCFTPTLLPSSPDPHTHTHTSHLKICLWVEEIYRCVCGIQ
jgi:hypothetical protein